MDVKYIPTTPPQMLKEIESGTCFRFCDRGEGVYMVISLENSHLSRDEHVDHCVCLTGEHTGALTDAETEAMVEVMKFELVEVI